MLLVNNLSAYETALEFIRQSDILAYDIETTGLNVRKDTIIGIGISNATDGVYFPILAWDGERLQDVGVPRPLIIKMLELLKHKKLITWNASFDMTFTDNFYGVDLLSNLHADVLLMKHTCDEEFPFGLKEVATKLWGHDAKQEKEAMLQSVKSAGGTAKEYYKASTDLLAKYCVSDCILTFKCYNYYSKELRKAGLEGFYYHAEVLPLYKNVSIPMERRGIRLDLPLMLQTREEIKKDIDNLEENIQTAIKPCLEIFTSWFLNKDYPPSRSGAFAQSAIEYYGMGSYFQRTASGAFSLTDKSIQNLPECMLKSILKQEAYYPESDIQPIQLIMHEKHGEPGYMFNLQSKHHLKKLFFDTLKETPLSRTPTGQPQVDENFLDSVTGKYTWAADLVKYNKLNKILSTYIERFLEEQENGIFYPSYLQHRTVSGRYSSDFQQLPRPLETKDETDLVAKYTNLVRSFFISRDGYSFIDADYEQLEPTVFAHNSGDSGLIAIFNNGLDFYSEVALRTEKLQGFSSDKRASNYLGKLEKATRQRAKAYALGIAYGMSGYKLKFEINCSEEAAERLVKDYYEAFPKLKQTMDNLQFDAKTKGFVASSAGRIRRLYKAKQLYGQYGQTICDDLALWKKYHEIPTMYKKAKEDRKTFKNLMNNALNFPIQSLAASIVNRACILLAKRFKEAGLNAYLIGQIHDEVLVECPDSEIDTVKQIMQNTLENVVKLSVPLRAVPQNGKRYSEVK